LRPPPCQASSSAALLRTASVAATGSTRRTADARDSLAPQEVQIARLAARGQTNTDIAAQLYLSHRTVEWHLHKVFAKLDIISRKGLAEALPASRSELVPV
jgi:DNA-binding NarL/FixJ family response regulator